ncbi:MAG: hypothetical protein NC821_03940, partial [Candidatus Omnitrophica bacterium]|nr:hypothetical protein [Candidatus Omnitrophota bacterium]
MKVKIEDIEIDLKEENFYWVDLFSKLIFPAEEKERGYKEALEKLTESIRDLINTKKREGSYEGILKNWIGELEKELKT